MNKLTSSLLASLSFLLLLPGAKGGCVNDEVVIGGDGGGDGGDCSLIGCSDTLAVSFDRQVDGPFEIVLTADGQTEQGTCDPAAANPTLDLSSLGTFLSCSRDGLELLAAPTDLELTVTAPGAFGTLSTAPSYDEVRPNGPTCDPVCKQATLVLPLTEGDGCFVGGCSGQLCTDDPNAASTCEWSPEYACYQSVGVCERGANGACGWRDTPELTECKINAQTRDPVVGQQCVRNAGDTCTTDADCMVGGCGGEVCFNPAQSGGDSSCDCGPPSNLGCGCVGGQCTWYE